MSEIANFFNINISSINTYIFIIIWIILALMIFKTIMYFKVINAISSMKKDINEINGKMNNLINK